MRRHVALALSYGILMISTFKKAVSSGLIAVLVFVLILINGCGFENVESQKVLNYKNNIDSQYPPRESKVVFEGLSVAGANSLSDISEMINNQEGRVNLVIELNNEYDGAVYRPDDESLSMQEIQAIVRQQRDNVKSYYQQTNSAIAESLGLEALDADRRADDYAPFVMVEFNGELTENDVGTIYTIAENADVSTVFVRIDVLPEPELYSAINAVGASPIVTNTNTNGSGVTIGILDVGIADKNNANFQGVNLTVRNEWWFAETVSPHTTAVTSVAGGIYGVARGAKLLSVQAVGEPSGEIGWMLDRNVNIISMSYSMGTKYGEYTSDSAYCDHIARNNWVTFVSSSGNRGESDAYTISPNGYNMLTVGASNNVGGVTAFSSYKEKFNINFPNIIAPGQAFSIPNVINPDSDFWSGTSFSAPFTAGACAIMMQNTPVLAAYPENMLTILMATASRIPIYAVSSGFHDQAGTGMLNINRALSGISNRMSFTVSNDSKHKDYVSTKSVYLQAGQRIRVAFASLVNNNKAVNTSNITDYDLMLFNPSNTQIAASVGTHNNEFIDYVAPSAGTYTIKIYQYGLKKNTSADYCSYTYFID